MAPKHDLSTVAGVPGLTECIQDVVSRLRRGALPSHEQQVAATCRIFELLLESEHVKGLTANQLSTAVAAVDVLVGTGAPATATWGARNLCRRVLSLIHEEAEKEAAGAAEEKPTLAGIEARLAALSQGVSVTGGGRSGPVEGAPGALPFAGALREGTLEGFAELQGETEVEAIIEGMAPSLTDLLRPGDAVLLATGCAGTAPEGGGGGGGEEEEDGGRSADAGVDPTARLLLAVMRAASDPDLKRPFEVFVQEGGPGAPGRDLAYALASPPPAGLSADAAPRKAISTTLILDSSVVALLPRVTKLFVPALAISADGSVVVPAGVYPLAVAAQSAGRPVIAVGTLLHLCREEDGAALGFGGPAGAAAGAAASGRVLPRGWPGVGGVGVVAPLREVLPARLVTAYLLDTGLVAASGIRQLVAENY